MKKWKENGRNEIQIEHKINGVIEEIAGHGNVFTATAGETVDKRPEKLNEGELTGMKGKGWWKGCRCPRGNDASKTSQSKNSERWFHNIESAKDKLLKAVQT